MRKFRRALRFGQPPTSAPQSSLRQTPVLQDHALRTNFPARRASLSSQPTVLLQISMTRRLARAVPARNYKLRCEGTRVTCSSRDPGATRCPSINKKLVAATFNSKKGAEIPFISGSHGTSLLRIQQVYSAKLRALSVSALSLLRSSFPFNPNGRSSPFLYVITSLLHCVLTSFPLPGSILPTSSPQSPPAPHQSPRAGRIAPSYLPIRESAGPCDTPPE